MNKVSTFKQKFPWRLMTFLAVAIAIGAIAPYATFNTDNFNNATARYATESLLRQVVLYVHIFASGIALVLGPFQFLSRLRQRRPSLHRWMGRIYLTGVLLGGLSAFIIAPGIISGMVGEMGLLSLAILWLWTGWMAYRNIRAGHIQIHRDWMTRNYALTFAAVILRLWLGTLIATQVPFLETRYAGNFDDLFVEVYRVVMWLSWVPNLIVAEMIVQRRRTSQLTLESQSVTARLQSSSS